ncbi:MAG: hypothetical protein AAF583_00545 [Pseudomonadota bacterium]
MVQLVPGKPFEQKQPLLRVNNRLKAGVHRIRLVVIDEAGLESAPADLLVKVKAKPAVKPTPAPPPKPPRRRKPKDPSVNINSNVLKHVLKKQHFVIQPPSPPAPPKPKKKARVIVADQGTAVKRKRKKATNNVKKVKAVRPRQVNRRSRKKPRQ